MNNLNLGNIPPVKQQNFVEEQNPNQDQKINNNNQLNIDKRPQSQGDQILNSENNQIIVIKSLIQQGQQGTRPQSSQQALHQYQDQDLTKNPSLQESFNKIKSLNSSIVQLEQLPANQNQNNPKYSQKNTKKSSQIPNLNNRPSTQQGRGQKFKNGEDLQQQQVSQQEFQQFLQQQMQRVSSNQSLIQSSDQSYTKMDSQCNFETENQLDEKQLVKNNQRNFNQGNQLGFIKETFRDQLDELSHQESKSNQKVDNLGNQNTIFFVRNKTKSQHQSDQNTINLVNSNQQEINILKEINKESQGNSAENLNHLVPSKESGRCPTLASIFNSTGFKALISVCCSLGFQSFLNSTAWGVAAYLDKLILAMLAGKYGQHYGSKQEAAYALLSGTVAYFGAGILGTVFAAYLNAVINHSCGVVRVAPKSEHMQQFLQNQWFAIVANFASIRTLVNLNPKFILDWKAALGGWTGPVLAGVGGIGVYVLTHILTFLRAGCKNPFETAPPFDAASSAYKIALLVTRVRASILFVAKYLGTRMVVQLIAEFLYNAHVLNQDPIEKAKGTYTFENAIADAVIWSVFLFTDFAPILSGYENLAATLQNKFKDEYSELSFVEKIKKFIFCPKKLSKEIQQKEAIQKAKNHREDEMKLLQAEHRDTRQFLEHMQADLKIMGQHIETDQREVVVAALQKYCLVEQDTIETHIQNTDIALKRKSVLFTPEQLQLLTKQQTTNFMQV